MGNLKYRDNQYTEHFGIAAFDKIPKSVWAAIAISALTIGGQELETAHDAILHEWECLYLNGIVPQKPIKL